MDEQAVALVLRGGRDKKGGDEVRMTTECVVVEEGEGGSTLQKKLSLRPMMHSQNSLLFMRYWAAHTSGLSPLRAICFASVPEKKQQIINNQNRQKD
jgi:hypothetical protein